MTTPFANNFQAPAQAQGAGQPMGAFVIPADPTWEPMEFGDYLPKEGYFCFKIVGEKPHEKGVFLTLEVQDPDCAGKRVQTLLDNLEKDQKKIWKWRGLIMSITGNKDAGKAQFQYNPGVFTGQLCYAKTSSYAAQNGDNRTGTDNWVTRPEWEAQVAGGKHRWDAEVKASNRPAGYAPAGLPGGFPVPGAPVGVPMPNGMPMQQAPAPVVPQPPPQPAAPMMFPGQAATPQAVQPPQPAFAAPPAGTVPQPGAVPFKFPGQP